MQCAQNQTGSKTLTSWQEQCEAMPLAELKRDVPLACRALDRLTAEAGTGRIESAISFGLVVTAVSVAYQRLEDEGDHSGALDVIRAFAEGGQV